MKRRTFITIAGATALTTSCKLLAAQQHSSSYLGLNVGSELNWSSWRGQLLPLYKDAGVKWLRVWYNWASFEPQPGVYKAASLQQVKESLKLAKESGFQVLFMIWGTPPHAGNGKLGSAPKPRAFSDYCRWLKVNLRGLVDAWEIGNEPNLEKYYSGSAASYIRILEKAYRTLKGNGLVIAAGPSGAATPEYWRQLIDRGLENHCDRVNLHPYRKTPREVISKVDEFLKLVQKPLWITELGLSADNGGEEAKAQFVRDLLPALNGRVEKLFWYRSIQGKGLHPLRFGLIEANRETRKVTPLPAYFAYRDYAKK